MIIEGNIVDIKKRRIFAGKIKIENGTILEIDETDKSYEKYIIPGFIDSHIHIESSMLTPYEFSRIALKHGTLAVVTDPHEIANVMGIEGIDYMLASAEKSPMKFFFGAPSCVPASDFDSSGAILDAAKIKELIQRDDIHFLAEMMNVPGVINENQDVLKKLEYTRSEAKPIDGHAPALSGKNLDKYIKSGISTDHEASTLAEAEEKIKRGMKIQIRQGSAAKDYPALKDLIRKYPQSVMLCSDDLHPNNLENGHINLLVKQALQDGFDFFDIMQAAILNPIIHYNLDVGLLQEGDKADFLVVDNIDDLQIEDIYIEGEKIEFSDLTYSKQQMINNFKATKISKDDIKLEIPANKKIRVIRAFDRSLVTDVFSYLTKMDDFEGSQADDILKIVVKNRYHENEFSVGFIRGFELKNCAIASSVAHDSHNIIAVGTADELITKAINAIIEQKGGLVYCDDVVSKILPLPIAGIISDLPFDEVSAKYEALEGLVSEQSKKIKTPFMTLAFMSLVVIPKIKINDKGIFLHENFDFVDLIE